MSNDISKIGVAAPLYPPAANNVTKIGVTVVTRQTPANAIANFATVAVLRAKVLVDSTRRRKGMVPIF